MSCLQERRSMRRSGAGWFLTVLFVLLVVRALPADAGSLKAEIDRAEQVLIEARAYRGNYPGTSNDPGPVRRRFLGVDDVGADCVPNASPGHDLGGVVDELVRLSWLATERDDRERIDRLINQAVQQALQGWVLSGNVSLLEGLRVSYPTGDRGVSGPEPGANCERSPYGSLEGEFNFLAVDDATRARLLYDEGVRVLLSSLRRNVFENRPVLVDVDLDPMPDDVRRLRGGEFDNDRHAQYTYYVDGGDPDDGEDDRVVPIQTQGHMMGNLLLKQGQAAQSIGHRLWTAAHFGPGRVEEREERRGKLIGDAVEQLQAGAHGQFLVSIALAATARDEAERTAESPYVLNRLHHVRNNVQQNRSTIHRIRNNEKPALPIDEIMVGDAQVKGLLDRINGSGPGSISKAKASYEAAEEAVRESQRSRQAVFEEEENRQERFFNRVEDLTGVSLDDDAGISRDDMRTAFGQRRYMELVAARVKALMEDPAPNFEDRGNRLDEAVKQVLYHRQQVLGRKAELDSYAERIKIVEDELGENVSAIRAAGKKITAAQLAAGVANSVSVRTSASVTVGTLGPRFSAGVEITHNPGAIKAAEYQNDATRAGNLQQEEFRRSVAAARIRNLLLDQDRAHHALKSQAILLRNAEDSVNNVLGDTERILERLREYDEATAGLWYNDPVWSTEATRAEEQANLDLASLVANLYELGRVLEIRWLEPFANPVSVEGREPVGLGPDYESFTSLESVFSLPFVKVNSSQKPPPDLAQDFLSALKEWDRLLRTHRQFGGNLATVEISLRQDVFGFADVKETEGRGIELADTNSEEDERIRRRNRRLFQNMLIDNGLFMAGDTETPRGFLLEFPLRYHQNGFTDGRLGLAPLFGVIPAWNYRVSALRVKIEPVAGREVFEASNVPIIFAQAGIVENIDFFERGKERERRRLRTYNMDNYVRYDKSDLGLSGSSSFLLYSFVEGWNYVDMSVLLRDGDMGAGDMAHRFWSPFSSNWLLQFSAESPTFEIENIDDIIIEMTLEAGVPGCPAGWPCQ